MLLWVLPQQMSNVCYQKPAAHISQRSEAFQRKYSLFLFFLNLKLNCRAFNTTICRLQPHDSPAALADLNLKGLLPLEKMITHCYASEETGTGLRSGVWPPPSTSAGFPNLFPALVLRWLLKDGLELKMRTQSQGRIKQIGAFTAPSVEQSDWITFTGAPLWIPLAALLPWVFLHNAVTNRINAIRKLLQRKENKQKKASQRPVMQQLMP